MSKRGWQDKAFLSVGESTESDGESSYHGWSDGGWNSSAQGGPSRASISSDEPPLSSPPTPFEDEAHVVEATPRLPSLLATPRSVQFTPSPLHQQQAPSPSTATGGPYRRGTGGSSSSARRPSMHTAGSNIQLSDLTNSATSGPSSHGSILNMGEVTSPLAAPVALSNGNSSGGSTSGYASYPQTNPPPPSYFDASTSYAYPRTRRKSASSHAHAVAVTESETDEQGPLSATTPGYPYGHLGPKGKRKKSRGGSFSYLPFHRRRRASSALWPRWLTGPPGKTRHPLLPIPLRQILLILVAIIGLVLFAISYFKRNFEVTFELSVLNRRWMKREMDDVQPLRGCFDPHQMSPAYNKTWNKPVRQQLAPGFALRRGMSCYDFSSTIQPIPDESLEDLTFHTYWRSDLIPFSERQTATLTAFLATQPLTHSKLIIWTNGADVINSNEHVRGVLEKWGEYISVRQVDMHDLTRGTELEGLLGKGLWSSNPPGSPGDGGKRKKGGMFDERAWVDGDAVRLLVLWHYGGVWMDMDMILTRDLHPLTESEFVTQWDCYDKPYFILNGALMHFRQHSPYLCEAFHIMASSPLPKPNTFTWGSHLYSKLHRRLLAAHIKPFAVLPWCFADPRNCDKEIQFPDPFLADPEEWGGRSWDGKGEVGKSGREMLEEKVGHVWTVHLHNQWGKKFPSGGWVERLVEGYKKQVALIEGYARSTGDAVGQRVYVKKDILKRVTSTPEVGRLLPEATKGAVAPAATAAPAVMQAQADELEERRSEGDREEVDEEDDEEQQSRSLREQNQV